MVETLAHHKMGDVVRTSDQVFKVIAFPSNDENAAMYLVSRLYTDAVFNQDIRAIQLIINRIDGGLPRDTDLASIQTQFGDCLNEVLGYEQAESLILHPDDTVMLALCKSLYAIATQNIYWDYKKKKPCKPTTERKQERDTAMRMILERTGGRRTLTTKEKEQDTVEVASWISALPDGN